MKRTFKLDKLILFITVLSNFISFSQERFKFRDIENHGLYILKEGELKVPDYKAEYRRPLHEGKYNKTIETFILKYEELNKQFDKLSDLDKKERRKRKKDLRKERENLLSKFKSTFDLLKRQDIWTSHFRGIEFNNSDLLERVKLELERLKGEPVNLEQLSERDLWTKIPKKMVKLKYISPANISTQIKGEYIIAGKINVATKNSVKDNIYKNQVLYEVVNNNYTIYRFYKSVDGSGVNFYNNTIDIYNEYMVEIAPKKLSKKEIETKRKVKLYLKQAEPHLKKMYNAILAHKKWTLTKAKRTSWVNATKKVKLIDKKIRALYGNNDENYYDFQKLLDTKTIEDKTYFDTVLNNSKQMLGMY
eukprot:TRINITY_DN10544_c0_g1_i1.p1 TRINITY_DN10544_c0_g1~~TRINITY_DN10544_c0_g1_i1.p1  ORF type:complete len:362 (-),score=55.26 TRINITY_DN10544_c0_g1_i1:88-1173(-)